MRYLQMKKVVIFNVKWPTTPLRGYGTIGQLSEAPFIGAHKTDPVKDINNYKFPSNYFASK